MDLNLNGMVMYGIFFFILDMHAQCKWENYANIDWKSRCIFLQVGSPCLWLILLHSSQHHFRQAAIWINFRRAWVATWFTLILGSWPKDILPHLWLQNDQGWIFKIYAGWVFSDEYCDPFWYCDLLLHSSQSIDAPKDNRLLQAQTQGIWYRC